MPYRTAPDPRRRLPVLDRITIPTPCTVPWDEMVGDAASRFCCVCSKTVYDLSAMDADDAEAFLEQQRDADRSACARLVRRPDGRVLTSECGPGIRRRHVKRVLTALSFTVAATAIAVVVAEPLTRPRLAPDEPWLEDRTTPMGAVQPSHQLDEMGVTCIPDVEEDEADVSETELARIRPRQAVEEAISSATLLGNVRLVHHHGARFME